MPDINCVLRAKNGFTAFPTYGIVGGVCLNRNNSSVKKPMCPRLHIHGKPVYTVHPYTSVYYFYHAAHFVLTQKRRGWMKRLGCPQRIQQTWWQIVATPYTGFTVLHNITLKRRIPGSFFSSRTQKLHSQILPACSILKVYISKLRN